MGVSLELIGKKMLEESVEILVEVLQQVTVQNLDVVKVDADLNMLVVRGAIPGPKGGVVYIKSTVKTIKVHTGATAISKNPQKASGRNPQKASARG